MFESIVASILNNVLGKYIKDLDSSNLRLGILKGNVVLTDLELRDDALDDLHLPVEVTHGYVGKISLTIPWTNPYSEPYEITVHDVYLIAGPIRDRKYDPERAKASEIATKRKRLAQIQKRIRQTDDVDSIEEKPTDEEDGSDSFVDKLMAQVLKNLKISVKNIHFRYEDKITSPNTPFAVGFTLENLSAETTNELWQECVVDASVKTVYKIVSLDCLSVYWNTNQKSATFFGTQHSWKELMSQGVSSKASVPADYKFILKPLSAECHVIMDQSTEIVLDTPKLLIEVLQQELSLAFSQNQFHNLMDMIESFELMTINQMYLKYQPTLPVRADPAAWWKYAYTAICEEKIRCWTWAQIKEHRVRYKLYKELWKRKLKGLNEDEKPMVLSNIQSLEDKLDIPNILIARKHAELEVPPSQRFNPTKKHKSSSWWSYIGFGSASNTVSTDYEGVKDEEEEIWSKLSVSALPAVEKDKLYKAIDYNESVRVKYPNEFVKSRVTFNLDSCTFILCDTTNREIAQLFTEGFEASLEHRPAQSAFRFQAKINSFKMLGSSEDKENKMCLVSSKTSLTKQLGTPLVQCTFETKPLKLKADYAVTLKVEPIEAIYDSHTIDKIVSFFSMPENTKLQELEVAAANKLQELRMWTRAGLEYAITHHEVTYLDIDVRSPFVVIPEYGTLQRDGSVLAVDLGHFTVVSNLASRDTSVRKASDGELEDMFYDKFEVTLDDVQVMIIDKGLNWKSTMGVTSSPHHILPSTALTVQLQKSITSDNAELPEFKVSSVLPSLHLKLSDEKVKMLMKFLDHLPVGVQKPSLLEEKRAEVISKREWRRSSSTLSLEEVSDLQAVVDHALAERLHSTEDEDVWFDAEENPHEERPEDERPSSRAAHEVDKIKLAGTFTVEKLLITIDKASELSAVGDAPPYLSLEIRDLGADLIVHSWDVQAHVKLGFIQLLDNHWKADIDGSNLCVLTSSSTKDWITVNYTKADPTGPEFMSKFHSIEQSMEVRFSSLKLTAKQEAIASFQIFVLSLFQSEPDWAAVPQRLLETITEEDHPDSSVPTKVAKKPQSDSDVVNIKIVAQIEDVTVILSSMGRHVGKVDVEGLDVKIDVFSAETNITTKLKDLRIDDLTEGTLYPHILGLADNTVFDCKVTIFNKSLQGSVADQDPTALDFSIDVKLGKLRFVFLGYFVAHLQNFLQAIASPETVAYAQDITQKVVLNQVQYIQKQGAKIGLKISVNSPQILIPFNTRSNEKLVADLGRLYISNSIVSSSKYGLIDRMDVRLSSFQVSGHSQLEKHLSRHLVEPIELNVIVKRRLNIDKNVLPLIEVEGNLELLKINLGINDFQMLMMVVNDNLLEGEHERQPAPESSEPQQDEEQKGPGSSGSLDRTDGNSNDEDAPSVKCHFTLCKVQVNSPKIIHGIAKPYLVLETKNMSATVTMETWILSAFANLGAIELLDHLNKDADGSPVKLLSSSQDHDLISVSYKRVDPRCPEYESTFCTIEQQINVTFSKLRIDCLQSALIDLQMHGLALIGSLGETALAPAPDSPSSSDTDQKTTSTVSLKVEAALSEVDVLFRLSQKNLADVKVRGLTAEFLLWENELLLKSRQKDLSVIDLNAASYYPKIISVENENVFDFEFKYFNNSTSLKTTGMSPAELTKLDGNLELNIGKINIVFLYRFIAELLQFVEPLTSPQSTQYVQETAQRAVTEQIESIQSQGTRIGLQVALSAPLVIIPRHSHSVDMLLVDLGHLDLQNEFDVLPLPKEHGDMEAVFDVMELSLQSVQLSRGVMDLSSSAVIKRYLIEPIKLDATIKRSLQPSGHDVPIIECSATLDFVKMNLGQHDYNVLTTLFQENVKESYESYVHQEQQQSSESVTVEHVEPSMAAHTSSEPAVAEQASESVWDQMVFSFDLAGASLTLYSNERPLDPFDSQSSFFEPATKLCLCEVEKSVVTVVLPSDSSVQIHCLLNGCVVEDVRQGTISAFPRIIDKKMVPHFNAVKSSPPQEMCDIVFCQLPSGEMKVDITLQNATIFVNFPFLLPLLEFFTTPPPVMNKEHQQVTAASQTSLDAAPVSALGTKGKGMDEARRWPEDIGIRAQEPVSQVDAAAVSSQVTQMKIFVHGVVKEPDIILLSDATRGDSEALIVQAEVGFDYNLEDAKQEFSAKLSGLQMQASQFPDVKTTSYKVLNPCSLTFKYLTPASNEGGQDIAIELQEMLFEFSPGLLTTVRNVVTAFTGQQKVDESVQTIGREVITAPADLWDTKPASPEYWYKKKATEYYKPSLVKRRATGDKLSLTIKEVQVVLVNEIEGAHVPLLLVRSSVKAKAFDWSAQLKVEADVAVEISYYNESLAAWEPLLEPVIVEEEKTMWEVQLKLFLAEGYVSSFSPKDVESCDGPPRDSTDGSKRTPPARDVTDSGIRALTQGRSTFKRVFRRSSLRCTGRRGRLGKRPRRYYTGTMSDDEDDLDYDGAVSTFIQSTQKAFSDPTSEVSGLDTVDAPLDEAHAEAAEKQTQATYIVINSHDVMQLTVTPTAVQILSELSQLWTTERTKTLRTVPGPTFLIHNELGIHASVTVSPKHQILDENLLTVRKRIVKKPATRLSLADAAVTVLPNAQGQDVRRIWSEPLFNRLRDKLHKIRRKRASSEPISLDAIRQRKLSLQNTVSFQVGMSTKPLKKGFSVDSGMSTDGKVFSPPLHTEVSSDQARDHTSEDEPAVNKASTATSSASPPPEEYGRTNERGRTHESQSSYSVGLAGTHIGRTVAGIGSLIGGIAAPSQTAESKDTQSESTESNVSADDDNCFSLTVDGFYNISVISIARSGSYLHKLSPKDASLREANHKWYLVVQVEIKNGRKKVTIRSPLQIQNHLQVAVDIFVKRKGSSDSSVKLFTVEPGEAQNVPLYTAYNEELFVKPSNTNYNLSSSALSWSKFSKEEPSCVLACASTEGTSSSRAFYIKALCQADSLNKLPSDQDSPHHVINLYPPLVVHNMLPFDLELSAQEEGGEDKVIHPGDKLTLVTLCPGDACQMTLTMKSYKDASWIGHLAVKKEHEKSLALLMASQEEEPRHILLGVLTMHQSGTREMLIYSPYWLINKTGLHVEYRVSKTKQVYVQSAVEKHPLLFNFTGMSQRKAKLRLPGHPWSSKFSLDAVGDSGRVACKTNDSRKFEFILQIEMSRTGLTKIVTLTPKYVIINNTEISVSFIENKCKDALWFVVEPGESKPFWPINKSSAIVLKQTMTNVISKPFSFNSSHTTVLRIAWLQALTVDVHGEVEDSVTTIVVTPYSPGVGTIRIENLCDNIPIRFHQKDNGQITVLYSKQMILYTWDDPQGVRKLFWKPYTGIDKPVEVPVDKDDFGEIRVELDESSPPIKDERKQLENRDVTCGGMMCSSTSEVPEGMEQGVWDDVDGPMHHRVKKTIYWVSVMDGLQRVLIFSDSENLSCLARKCCDYEVVNMELFMSLDGVGLSLINNKPVEVAYITLSSSSSIWQVERSTGRWKTLNLELSTWLEDAWRNNAEAIELEDRKVDLNSMRMMRPHAGRIRRLFEPALWFNYTNSDHYHSLHCKMHRIQIDNQQIGTVFPVALYPSPLPSSVIQKSGFKPFIEVSVIYHQVPKEGMYHIKYAKALVQEMNVKVDKGFLISMAGLFSQQKELLEEENYFEEDMKRVAVPLRETEAVKAALEAQKVFLEFFHLSPLKINLSFSLASALDEEDEEQAFAQDLMDFFVDSIGATLTDINDAELKLAYFERVSVFLTQENLVAQISRHYTMQGVRQVYVLVLGLDVLGNPYALIHGIGEGVRDFFYEPYQGIIAGPGEFAEGVARGVKSLLGHVIGGTAGAFSRITGSLGQAVATLTFDSNFQMRRRLRMHREPHGIGQGLIMGGKSLFMGLFFGVSGVVVKPVEGARSEGVEGFFKGIGKGLLGLLTHPAGGVIDMVSFTLDGVRRSAEFNGEDIACRRRLPRFTAPNMPLKPFSAHDAEGNGILKSLDQFDDVYVDHLSITREDNSFIILLTDRRILNLYQRKFWQSWSVRWSCLYEKIAGFPCLTANSLVIKQESDKDEGSTIDPAAPTYEVVSLDKTELETLKFKIDSAIRHFR